MNELSNKIIGAAIEAHKELGPGLLESTYEACLAYELNQNGLEVSRQEKQLIRYKGLKIDEAYRLDLLVEGEIILELKAIDQISHVHIAQLLTYLKLSDCTLGYLMNFNVSLMKDGIRRVVNNHPDS